MYLHILQDYVKMFFFSQLRVFMSCMLVRRDSFPDFTEKLTDPSEENFKIYEALNKRADQLERTVIEEQNASK